MRNEENIMNESKMEPMFEGHMNLEMIKNNVAELANFNFIAYTAEEAANVIGGGLEASNFYDGPGLYYIAHGVRGEIDDVMLAADVDIITIEELLTHEEEEEREYMREYYNEFYSIKEDCEHAGVLNFSFCEESFEQWILVK